MNGLEFRYRMYLYAIASVGIFRIDVELEPLVIDKLNIIKIKAKPFTLDIMADDELSTFEMINRAAKVFTLDMMTDDELSLMSVEECPVAVIHIDDITSGDGNIKFDIIGANTKMYTVSSQLQDLRVIVNTVAAKVKAMTQSLEIEDIQIANGIQAAKSNDSYLTSILEHLVVDLQMDLTTPTVENFAMTITTKETTEITIGSFEAALIALSIASYAGIDITAVNAKVNEYDIDAYDEAVVDIILTALKYMTIGDYADTTLGEMDGKTLSQLYIRIR